MNVSVWTHSVNQIYTLWVQGTDLFIMDNLNKLTANQ